MKIKDIHLIAFYTQKPKPGVLTQVKGWNQDPNNISYDERVEFTRGLNAKDQQYAGVILNLKEKRVVYNKFGNEKTFDDLFKYFLEAYPEYVIKVMAQLDMPYLEQFIPKEDPKSEEEVAKELQELHGMTEEEAKQAIAEVKGSSEEVQAQ